MADWMSRPGADVEFLVSDPKEAAGLEAAFRKDPQDKSLVGRYRLKGEAPGAEAQPDFTGRLKQWFTQAPEPSSIRGQIEGAHPVLGMLGTGQRMLAEAVLPGTNTGAAVDAAALAAPGILPLKAAEKALPAVAKVAGRIGIPAAAGAGMGAIQKGAEGAAEGAKLGGMAGVAGEATGMLPAALGAFYKKYGHFNTEAFKRVTRNKIGPQVANAIAEDIPSLGAAMPLTGTGDLDTITEPLGGQRVIGKLFDKVEGNIVGVLGAARQKVPMPFGALMALGRASGKMAAGVNPTAMVDINPAEAIRIVKELRAKAFAGGTDTALGQPLREISDAATQSLLSTVQKADPQLYSKYVQLREDYGKFLDVKDFFKGRNTNLLPTMTDGAPTIDLPRMYDAMRSNNSTMDKARFPTLWQVFEGSAGAGGPVAAKSKSLPRVVAGGSARIAESIAVPGRVKLTPELEKSVGTQARIDKGTDRARRAGAVLSVPAIEQMLLDQRTEQSQPLPSEMLKR